MNERLTPSGRPQPICHKCGNRHYGFVECHKVDNFDELVKENIRVKENKAHFEIQWRTPATTWTFNDQIVSTGFHRNDFRKANRWNTST